ncbi:MAG: S41 family peptidase [Bdellovibrionales bacterium]|nr:S41 family peptidase [Bdellovibrionales bacterium]
MVRTTRIRLAIFTGVCLSLGMLIGCLFEKPSAKADKVAYRELEKFSKVLQYIESDFVEERKTKDLVEGAIRGMMQTLDPHSAYMNAEVFKEMKVETSGKFGGLGIEVSVKGGVLTIVSPIDDTPAYKAGVKAGDRIVRIDGKSTKNMTLPEAITMMRGKTGSKISITVVRQGVDAPIEFKLTRESIRMQSVRSVRLNNNIGYVRISSFMERTSEELAKALDKLSEKGRLEGVILDLRANPGGLLDQAVKVVNLFVDEGPVVYTIGRDRAKKEAEFAQKGRMKTDAPLVVLVDGASASASEIVAGALQDYGRGVIAGQRTFGKGSVQTIIPMNDDAGLKLTIARYYTPSGRSIQARGIVPDVEIDEIDAKSLEEARLHSRHLREADLEGHFENDTQAAEDDDEPLPPTVTPKEAKEAKESKELKDAAKERAKEDDDMFLPLEQRLKKDYMVMQAQGVLRTMTVMRKGIKKPEFKLEEEPKKEASAAKDASK